MLLLCSHSTVCLSETWDMHMYILVSIFALCGWHVLSKCTNSSQGQLTVNSFGPTDAL